MNIDTTIHLSDIFLVGGGIAAFLKAFLWQRDINRDVIRILKGEDGKNGLVSQVQAVRHDMYEHGGVLSRVKHSIANIKTGLFKHGIELPHDEH